MEISSTDTIPNMEKSSTDTIPNMEKSSAETPNMAERGTDKIAENQVLDDSNKATCTDSTETTPNMEERSSHTIPNMDKISSEVNPNMDKCISDSDKKQAGSDLTSTVNDAKAEKIDNVETRKEINANEKNTPKESTTQNTEDKNANNTTQTKQTTDASKKEEGEMPSAPKSKLPQESTENIAVLEVTHQEATVTEGVQTMPVVYGKGVSFSALVTKQEDTGGEIAHGDPSTFDSTQPPTTLEAFANVHFRPPGKKGIFKHHSEGSLWSYTKEPIREALLKKSLINQDLAKYAVTIFSHILKYINDSKRQHSNTELTDQIFRPAIVFEPLRDEVYCQIVKQLTHNKHKQIEDKAWELMWLLTGQFVCTQPLLSEVLTFLQSRQTIGRAVQCYERMQKTLKTGQRKQPPHFLELEAVQKGHNQIQHLVTFPNGCKENFMVNSWTKACDLSEDIIQSLKLLSGEGFSLFVMFADKVLSVPDNNFLFDFLKTTIEWGKAMKLKELGSNMVYQLCFMRKLWLNVVPGKDVNADCIFHYHQELPKLLKGYHDCTVDEAAVLAAFQYRVRHGNDRSYLHSLWDNKHEYLPVDLIDTQTQQDWEKAIGMAYDRHQKTMTRPEAKVAFMNVIHNWPTFGTSFFEIKQECQTQLPEILMIGISKDGVALFDRKTKKNFAKYPFTKISTWSSGHNYFHITFGNMVKGTKMTCHTPLGYKMDDLITSYIAQLLKKKGKAWPQHR